MKNYQPIKQFVAPVPSKETGVHHIFSQSTFPYLKFAKWNQVKVPTNIHSAFHALFTNRSPKECLAYLVNIFWGGHIEFLEEFVEEYKDQKSKEVI